MKVDANIELNSYTNNTYNLLSLIATKMNLDIVMNISFSKNDIIDIVNEYTSDHCDVDLKMSGEIGYTSNGIALNLDNLRKDSETEYIMVIDALQSFYGKSVFKNNRLNEKPILRKIFTGWTFIDYVDNMIEVSFDINSLVSNEWVLNYLINNNK